MTTILIQLKHNIEHMALVSCVKRDDASKHQFYYNIVVIHGYLVRDEAPRAYARTRPPPPTAMTMAKAVLIYGRAGLLI